MVDIIKPPITTVAKGFCTSPPAPVLMAMGIKPKAGTKAVINTALNFDLVACITIRIESCHPSAFNLLNSETNKMPFKTATPNKAINPTPADILNGISLAHKAKIPPIADNGMAVYINKPCFTEPKAKYNNKKIRNKAIGTTTLNLSFAAVIFSKDPPYTMVYPFCNFS